MYLLAMNDLLYLQGLATHAKKERSYTNSPKNILSPMLPSARRAVKGIDWPSVIDQFSQQARTLLWDAEREQWKTHVYLQGYDSPFPPWVNEQVCVL